MLNKKILILFFLLLKALTMLAQNKAFTGTYMKIETHGKYKVKGIEFTDIDTTMLQLNSDSSFIFKWSPLVGPYSKTHLYTTGHYKKRSNKLYLTSSYQTSEHRIIESHKEELGDSLSRVYIQTYDSLRGFFTANFVAGFRDTTSQSAMIFPDREMPEKRCRTELNLKKLDSVYIYGDIGQFGPFRMKNKNTNCVTIQLNWSTNWDYQYMDNDEWELEADSIVLWGVEDNGERTKYIILMKQ